jgi:hypothetical protein
MPNAERPSSAYNFRFEGSETNSYFFKTEAGNLYADPTGIIYSSIFMHRLLTRLPKNDLYHIQPVLHHRFGEQGELLRVGYADALVLNAGGGQVFNLAE